MTPLRLGLSTLPWYYEPDLVSYLPLLAEAGVRHIELRRLDPHVDISCAAAIHQFISTLSDLGIAIHSVHMPTDLIQGMCVTDTVARKQALTEAKRVAEGVVALQSSMLVTHAGAQVTDIPNRADVYQACLDSLTELCEFCGELGLPVAVENTLPSRPRIGDTIPELVQICSSLDPKHVGYCLDTGHANLSGCDVADAVGLLGDRLRTLHVSDNDGVKDEHAMPYDGIIDWRSFMVALNRVQYQGVFMMEVRGAPDLVSAPKEAVARFARLLAE